MAEIIKNLSEGSIELPQVSAPGTTTDKLYNVGGALTFNGTDISAGGGIADIVEDTTPQLGGNLDVNGFNIDSVDGAEITVTPGIGVFITGNQVVDVGGAINNPDPTGLANDATVYTASVVVDGGGSQAIAVTGSNAQDYEALLAELNADTTGAVWSLTSPNSGGEIQLSSNSLGSSSTIAITDTDLFSSLTDFVAILSATVGDGDGSGSVNVVGIDNDIVSSSAPSFGGSVNIVGGNLPSSTTSNLHGEGGDINLTGGNVQESHRAYGGRLHLDGGDAYALVGASFGGSILIGAGEGYDFPGDIVLEGGAAYQIDSGSIIIQASSYSSNYYAGSNERTTKLRFQGLKAGTSLGLSGRLLDNFVALRAPDNIPSEFVLILPSVPPSTGQVLEAGTISGGEWPLDWVTPSAGGISNVVEDTTPQLGGALDTNGYNIVTADADGPDPINIIAGADTDSNDGGAINITAGISGTSGDGGVVNITGGAANSGAGGYRGGAVIISGGQGHVEHGGNVEIYGGSTTNGAVGGSISLTTGSPSTGAAGNISLFVSPSIGSSQPGQPITLNAGEGGLRDGGGDVRIYGGASNSTSGDGGSILLQAAYGVNGTSAHGIGGDITITPGAGAGSGSAGAIVITATAAPTVTTNKLYNVAGALTWDGTDLTAGGGGGGLTVVVVTTTSATAAAAQATMVDDDTAAGVVTITLPAGSANDQQVIKKLGTTANVIVDGDSAETIDGAATFTLTAQYASLSLIWNGTEWSII